jgi:hypothetical protein
MLDGVDIPAGVAARAKRGVGQIFQLIIQLTNLFPNLPVHENICLGVQARASGGDDVLSVRAVSASGSKGPTASSKPSASAQPCERGRGVVARRQAQAQGGDHDGP